MNEFAGAILWCFSWVGFLVTGIALVRFQEPALLFPLVILPFLSLYALASVEDE